MTSSKHFAKSIMNIDQAFILSAGKGTRMGELGKHLPKPLWNIFETTLLGLQIKYVQSLGINNIVVNSHHLHQQLHDYIKENFSDVRLSYEEQLLGSGGGVHKVLNEGLIEREKPFLVLNSDSYLYESEKNWEALYQAGISGEYTASLFLSAVTKTDSYNAVLTDQPGVMLGIEKDKSNIKAPYTYSGFGIIFPSQLTSSSGESSFFSTVADYKNKKVVCKKSESPFIDFGTLEIYKRIIREGIDKNSYLHRKLLEFKSIDLNKMENDGYGLDDKFDFVGVGTMAEDEIVSIGNGGKRIKVSEGVGLYRPS